MADDPGDVFDKFADDIRNKKDELDAVDELRSARATEERKRKQADATAAPAESTPRPKDD